MFWLNIYNIMQKYKRFLSAVSASLPSVVIKRGERFSQHTSMGVGGRMALYAEVSSERDILSLIKICKEYSVPYFIIGNGTNIIASDKYHDILVIKVAIKSIKKIGNKIVCGAGVSLFSLNQFAIKHHLSGLEWSYGLPASVGGAVKMNAGSFAHEMKEVVSLVYFTDGIRIYYKHNKSLDFSYRHSFFSDKNFIILKVVFALKIEKNIDLLQNCLKFLEKRHLSQPYDKRSAGSIFKRPYNNYAPILIEKCDLKGMRIGGAEVSKKHCGFIVNLGGASAEDIFRLICKIKKTVSKKFDIMLEEEVILLK